MVLNRGRFDERCPHCKAKIGFYDAFTNSDYESEFTFDCPECGGKIDVDVHTVPEFEARKHEPYQMPEWAKEKVNDQRNTKAPERTQL